MLGYGSSDDYRPLFYARGHAVHLTTLLVAIHIVALVAWCLLRASGIVLDGPLEFSSEAVLRHGQVWRLVTYALLHQPSIGFAIEMAMLFMFGRETERFLGQRAFGWLYAGLLFLTPVLLCGWALLTGPKMFAGTSLLHFGIFIAFAAIYPNVQIFFGIAAKWIAIVLLGIYSLLAISGPDWIYLTLLWADAGGAVLGVRLAGAGGGFDWLNRLPNPFPKRAAIPRGVVKPRARPRRAVEAGVPSSKAMSSLRESAGPASAAAGDVHESIDPLLEKISKHGLASLSASERAQLERARASLLRKDRSV